VKMANRLDALEGKATSPSVGKWHELVAPGNETEGELIDAYGREKIGSNDSIIILRLVAPRFDGDGNMIFHKDWPQEDSNEAR